MKEKAFELAKKWSQDNYISKKDRQEIQALLDDSEKNEEEIIDRFYQDLEFGTGGMRSVIGVGSNRMNQYNIRKATQAMCDTLRQEKPTGGKACISYDNRRFSKEFAMQVAGVFAANGIKAYIYEALTPTPMLSYAIRYYAADCGVMVTASHNPK
ncbi:MAG: phospho-sugar mutase, partial [Halobacteriovoraceae bacterium]|nr:phospho-sugar mutase [Halobacteriovoraceae bacterium]